MSPDASVQNPAVGFRLNPPNRKKAGREALVSLRAVSVEYGGGGLLRRAAALRAVDRVDLKVGVGETMGLVGESGSGKSTLGRAILGLVALASGAVDFDGRTLDDWLATEPLTYRQRAQMVFQDPYSSLNPRHSIGKSISGPLKLHGFGTARQCDDLARDLLGRVGLSRDHFDRYPNEFSGGQRQRVGIARALALEPDFVICDEPVSSLDVSTQAQVLKLLKELQEELQLSMLFIAHDLAVVQHVSDVVAVMYLGQVVECGPVATVYRTPSHPYTQALLAAAPRVRGGVPASNVDVTGEIPSPLTPPSGCRFHTRCWLYRALGSPDKCRHIEPRVVDTGIGGSAAACHYSDEARDLGKQYRPEKA